MHAGQPALVVPTAEEERQELDEVHLAPGLVERSEPGPLPEHGRDEVFLRADVAMDQSRVDVGRGGDVPQRGGCGAVGCEQVCGGLEHGGDHCLTSPGPRRGLW